eukprot:TRINITY_DN30512_c0_g1_i1.p1 TRINITY_DN30512_c0_g1~~TRINITY_DN30512_c0_g1_i1.p1  ORF type:complete len:498 (+),score=78.54 TRINITY_DN30512_c0_g1_i1:75-1568(+)
MVPEAIRDGEPVLARAAELYAEGMRFEEENEPQKAIDRYRRAVRMANERKILERLGFGGSGPAACSQITLGQIEGPPGVNCSEEDFQLWNALHMSKVEAQARNQTDTAASSMPCTDTLTDAGQDNPCSPSTTAGVANAFAMIERDAIKTFDPPSRRSHLPPETEPGELDACAEESDRMISREVRQKLSMVSEVRQKRDLVDEATAPTVVDDSAFSSGELCSKSERSPSLVSQSLEMISDALAFLDAFSLEYVSRACLAMRGMARIAPTWCALAKRCFPHDEWQHAVANIGSGSDTGHSWRRAFLLATRLRLDGIYVAPCGYRRRVPEGSSLSDKRGTLDIRYYRLLRALPEENPGEPRRRILLLTYEGELAPAVEALLSHPAGHLASYGAHAGSSPSDASSLVRKLHERVIVGTYSLDRENMALSVRYSDARSHYLMEFKLMHVGKNQRRRNRRLVWIRYEFTSHNVPEDVGNFNLHREQQFAPYTFARVRSLEHLF